jgi:protein-L-isoaspartate(D-aspartate) O-methyltransferase
MAVASNMTRKMGFSLKQHDKMLRDIRAEVKYTRRYIGKDGFDPRVMDAMSAVPRHEFVEPGMRTFAYDNGPLPIGWGQTISQPYIVALMTDLLGPRPDDVILEVGTGSGYQAAVLSQLVKKVYSLEIIPELCERASARLRRLGYTNVETRVGDGYHGWPEQAPFDGIIVTAAAGSVPPALVTQLKPGGRLVIPVGQPHLAQTLQVMEKDEGGNVSSRDVLSVAFVPLTGEH